MELSIVLVVIGLVAGGILVGRDLISAAQAKSQVSQIQQYRQAVNSFRGKFGSLPGDIPAADVTNFGFTAAPSRAGTAARGDGNGIIEGYYYPSSTVFSYAQSAEPLFFWEDLTTNSSLIPGSFNFATDTSQYIGSNFTLAFPASRAFDGQYLYVYNLNSVNYFGLSKPLYCGTGGVFSSSPAMTVKQAYDIDAKTDDGSPVSGNVVTQYITTPNGVTQAPNAATASATTCYDTTSNQYSITQNNGSGVNCALSFKFQ